MERGATAISKKCWILLASGGVEKRFSTIEHATVVGEQFLRNNPSECRVALFGLDEKGREASIRMIYHWRDDCFHYLDREGEGKTIRKLLKRPNHKR